MEDAEKGKSQIKKKNHDTTHTKDTPCPVYAVQETTQPKLGICKKKYKHGNG